MTKLVLTKSAYFKRKYFFPWIFKEDFEEIPQQRPQGDLVEVQTPHNEFFCYGYMNLESQIPVRALSFVASDQIWSQEFLVSRLLESLRLRKKFSRTGSFRMVFSEADLMPGLICDLYHVVEGEKSFQIFALQVLTYGMDRLLGDVYKVFETFTMKAHEEGLLPLDWERTGLVLRNDVKVREKEGLRIEMPRFVKTFREFEPNKAKIQLQTFDSRNLLMECDLYEGQKTGFFLDQHENIMRICNLVEGSVLGKKKIQVVDLCCYVGHWSAQLVHAISRTDVEVDFHLVDVSASALERAKSNAESQVTAKGLQGRIQIHCHKVDVLSGLDHFKEMQFDFVICDPPGFIKAKKDLEKGKGAYIRLNSEAFRLVANDGMLVTCSCSGLLSEEDFQECVVKGMSMARRFGKMIMKGGPSFDHPAWARFPQSNYLKMAVFSMLPVAKVAPFPKTPDSPST
ncbi:MAG: class I SAM-dependent rRNA methyltransferase [Pseudobdellovibrionaceae bacterium]